MSELQLHLMYSRAAHQMTHPDNLERKDGIRDMFRLCNHGYLRAIHAIGVMYYILQDTNYDDLILSKRFLTQAADLGYRPSIDYIDSHPDIKDLIDDGRIIRYPTPGGFPDPVPLEVNDLVIFDDGSDS